jgi:hypothetical protein
MTHVKMRPDARDDRTDHVRICNRR